MNKKKTVAGALALLTALSAPVTSSVAMPIDKNLAPLGRETSPRQAIIRVQATEPVLAPMAHIMFCNTHKDQCESSAPEVLQNDDRTFNALISVNQQVNAAIEPMQRNVSLVGNWQIGPSAGDCNDYAVTKRDRLIKRGFPASALLLAHVVTSWGEHHLVLVARTENADFVLDNLRNDIRRVEKSGYRWVRIQSNTQAKMWNTAQVKREAAPSDSLEIKVAIAKRQKPSIEAKIARHEQTTPVIATEEKPVTQSQTADTAAPIKVRSPAAIVTAKPADEDKWSQPGPRVEYVMLSATFDDAFSRNIRTISDENLF